MKQKFTEHRFRKSSLDRIEQANEILEGMARRGYTLTVRQLYYQFIGQNAFPNTLQNYKKLVALMTKAREAGLVDWNHLIDRTRKLRDYRTFESPAEAVWDMAAYYNIDMWEDQPYRLEVWVEKQALDQIVGRAAMSLDVPFFSCRGYMSASAMYEASNRMKHWQSLGYKTAIIHLGDHDPSGRQMTDDIDRRENELFEADVEINRIALEMDQIRELNLPPNPAKTTDRRFAAYQKEFGTESWELDALDPDYMHNLIVDTIKSYMDEDEYRKMQERLDEEKSTLFDMSYHFDLIREVLVNADDVRDYLSKS